jgi:hypothetical protein
MAGLSPLCWLQTDWPAAATRQAGECYGVQVDEHRPFFTYFGF